MRTPSAVYFIPPYKFSSVTQGQISHIAGAVSLLSRAETLGFPPRAPTPWQSGCLLGSELEAVTQPPQSRPSYSHLRTTTFPAASDMHPGPPTGTPIHFFHFYWATGTDRVPSAIATLLRLTSPPSHSSTLRERHAGQRKYDSSE